MQEEVERVEHYGKENCLKQNNDYNFLKSLLLIILGLLPDTKLATIDVSQFSAGFSFVRSVI